MLPQIGAEYVDTHLTKTTIAMRGKNIEKFSLQLALDGSLI